MGQAHRRRLAAQLCEKCCWSRSVRKGSQRTQRILGSAGQAGYHVIGVNTNALQLGDELSNNFRVRHPAPDWGWRRRATGRATGSRLVGRASSSNKSRSRRTSSRRLRACVLASASLCSCGRHLGQQRLVALGTCESTSNVAGRNHAKASEVDLARTTPGQRTVTPSQNDRFVSSAESPRRRPKHADVHAFAQHTFLRKDRARAILLRAWQARPIARGPSCARGNAAGDQPARFDTSRYVTHTHIRTEQFGFHLIRRAVQCLLPCRSSRTVRGAPHKRDILDHCWRRAAGRRPHG